MSRRRNAHTFNRERAQAAARRRWATPPPSAPDDGGGAPGARRDAGGATENKVHEPVASDSFSARERLEWEATHSPSATARVAAAKRLLDDEGAPEPEPEPTVAKRGVSLLDVLALAAACGMDLDALVAAAKARASCELAAIADGLPSV
jgi:hypothetical protein